MMEISVIRGDEEALVQTSIEVEMQQAMSIQT